MRALLLFVMSLLALTAAGCGWSPPSGNPPQAGTCTATDGPAADAVAAEVAALPAGGQWRETARGNTSDCRLYWVQVASGSAPDAPGQVLFFDKARPVGTATPDPRPYVTVVNSGPSTVTVQYQWRKGGDQPCCPTGIGSVRFQIADGAVKALDPVPGP